MAEWLGNGLQNRVQQFDSAWYLKRKSPAKGLFLLRYQAEGAVSDRSFSLSTPPDLPVGEAWSLRSERGGLLRHRADRAGAVFLYICERC